MHEASAFENRMLSLMSFSAFREASSHREGPAVQPVMHLHDRFLSRSFLWTPGSSGIWISLPKDRCCQQRLAEDSMNPSVPPPGES